MRLRVFLLFLAFQLMAFGLFRGVAAFWPHFGDTMVQETTHALRPSAMPRSVQLSARYGSKPSVAIPEATQQDIHRAIAKLPAEHTASLKNIVLSYDPEAARGLGGAHTIYLKTADVGDAELIGVLTHEIGHTVDLGDLNSSASVQPSEFKDGTNPIYDGDSSLDFYRISWANEKMKHREATNFDFVSGYAMTDPFEDFAESYAFYVLHGRDFRFLASTDDALLSKYTFMKTTVFHGQEFDTGGAQEMSAFRRVWDVTLVGYDLDKFLN